MKVKIIIKRIVSLLALVVVMFMPVSAVAAEVEVSEETSISSGYTDWIDQDISVYVPTINDTVHAHLRLLYSYGEGSWVYIADNPIPTLSGIYTETGYSEYDLITSSSSNGTVDFPLVLSSSTGVARVTLRVTIDIYGDINWFIL